ncbi:unnamed protein product [Rotaria sp. Silwood2]|nr:unnamed protein product [Rotaria sp. Silwood2]CAF4165830.1 unnamed protein product [Rotaria sp. Silwood2]
MINNCLKEVLSFISGCFTKIKRPLGKDDILFSSILVPVSGVFLVSLSIVIVLFEEFNTDDADHRVTEISNKNSSLLTLISEICEVILALIISLHSIYSLSKLGNKNNNPKQEPTVETVNNPEQKPTVETANNPEQKPTAETVNNSEQKPTVEPVNNPKQKPTVDSVNYIEKKSSVQTFNIKFKIDFSFLLIANIFLNIYSGLTFVGSVKTKSEDKLTQYIRWLTLSASVIPIIQTMLQSIVIWQARQYHRKLTTGINKMWIILSFAIWLFDTFSAKGYQTNQIQICVYDRNWDVLAAIFIPMTIFFRFHSCIIFANIKDGVYWNKEDHSSV